MSADCLACSAARRDAADLLVAAVEDGSIDSDRVTQLVSGMDSERSWRVVLYAIGIAASLVAALGEEIGLPARDVAHIYRDEITGGGDHDH